MLVLRNLELHALRDGTSVIGGVPPGASENLVFLCFDHHDEYDSKTRQSKNLTKEELMAYRDKLVLEVDALWANGTLDRPVPGTSPPLIVNVSNVGGAGGSSVFGGAGGGGGQAVAVVAVAL